VFRHRRLGDMFGLNLPQQIVIKNWRLQLVYNILLVIVGSAILCTFVLQKDFSALVRLDVRPTLYINEASDFSGFNASGGTDLVCDQDFEVPREIEKVSGQRLAIASHQCVHRCNFGDRSQLQKYLNPRDAYHCLSVADLVRHESPTLARMVTSTLAWDLHEAMSSTTTPPTANANVSLYPWLAKMKVTFEFTFESRSQLSWYFGATPGRIRGDQSHAHVVFVDAHGRPTHVFRQPSHVTLELSDILKMATVPASSENFDKTMLYWGAWLESTITCYNDMGDLEFGLEKVRSLDIHASTASPVCAIQVKQVGRAVSHETHTKNSTIHVLSIVSIKFTTSQSFMRLPSLWATIINLSSCVVVLQLPKSILRVLCSRMLGHLSLVYRQNLERSVDIAQYCAGWAMRVALIAANLYPMTPNTDEHLGYGAVPVRQLHRMLRLALGHHAALDEDDVHNILKYAFDEIGPQSRPKTYRKALTVVSKKEKFKGPYAPVQPLSSSAQLKIGHITELCISNDIVSFDAVAGLLDRRRPLGVLEKMFMPGKLLMPRTSSGSSSDTRLDSCSRPHGRSLMPGSMLGQMHTLSRDSAESYSTTSQDRRGSDLSLGMTPGPLTGPLAHRFAVALKASAHRQTHAMGQIFCLGCNQDPTCLRAGRSHRSMVNQLCPELHRWLRDWRKKMRT